MAHAIEIHGHVLPGYEKIREVFADNFMHRGIPVVDLWGGYRCIKTRQPWTQSTLVLTSSVTKGLATAVLAVAHSRGWFELDEPVCRYWPEFAHAGKEQITVRQLLTHQAGLAAATGGLRRPGIQCVGPSGPRTVNLQACWGLGLFRPGGLAH